MYLELADNYLNDNGIQFDTIPVMDPASGEIYMINAEAFLMLSRDEQIEAVNAAPFLLQKIMEQSGSGMNDGLFSRIRTGVSNFVQKASNIINPNVDASGVPKSGSKPIGAVDFTRELIPTPMPTSFGTPNFDPKFALNVGVEPSPKPWFARPEVLLPVIGGVAVLGYALIRRR